jgi:hypothetical protein
VTALDVFIVKLDYLLVSSGNFVVNRARDLYQAQGI